MERATFDLARGLAEATARGLSFEDFDVTLATRTERDVQHEDAELPFRVVRRPTVGRLWDLIGGADVVHLAGPAMLPLGMGLLRGKPIVIEHHGFQTVCPNGQYFYAPEGRFCDGYYMAGRYGKCIACNSTDLSTITSLKALCITPFRRWLSNRAVTNITPTKWLSSILNLRRMETIYHGSSPALKSNKSRVDIADRLTFAFQGRLVSTKGAGVLLDAATQLYREGAKFSARIIGNGPERSALEAKAAPLGSTIEFLGQVPDEELEQAYSGVSVVVVPSLAGEVFGLVAAENMVRGKALIVSDVGSLKEIAGDAATVVRAGDATELARAMRRFIQDPSAVSSVCDAMKNRAKQVLDMDAMIRSHVSVYQACLR